MPTVEPRLKTFLVFDAEGITSKETKKGGQLRVGPVETRDFTRKEDDSSGRDGEGRVRVSRRRMRRTNRGRRERGTRM